MWRALLFIVAATLAFAEPFHHFSGRVVDENGRAIQGAFFDNTGMPESEYLERFTNTEGRFDIWTSSSQIVVRKAGYREIVLTPKDASRHEFTMTPNSSSTPSASHR